MKRTNDLTDREPAKSKLQQLSWEMTKAKANILAVVIVKYLATHV